MKIKKIKVSNFRNLKEIDVNFGNINIITGKNSSGKTNLTQLLTNCLYTENDIEKVFGNNILTYGKGIGQTNIEVTIDNLNTGLFGFHDNNKLNLYEAFEYIHKFEIIKNPISIKKRSIDLFGKILEEQVEQSDIPDIAPYFQKLENSDLKLKETVYEEKNKIENTEENDTPKLSELSKNREHYFLKKFIDVSKDKIIHYDNNDSFSNCTGNIFNFVTGIKEINSKEISLQAVAEVNNKEIEQGVSNFSTAKFIFLLADIQRDEKQANKFNDDLSYYTDGILKRVYINMEGKEGSKGDIYIDSPHGPKNIEFISAGTAIILYFVLLQNWLSLKKKSYKSPDIMIFDELDSVIHPSLISKFSELLKIISNKVQLFISTHSPIFIDNFDKENVFLIKDIGSFSSKVKVKSNILSYDFILNKLNKKEQEIFKEMTNSELYVDGSIDTLFPINF